MFIPIPVFGEVVHSNGYDITYNSDGTSSKIYGVRNFQRWDNTWIPYSSANISNGNWTYALVEDANSYTLLRDDDMLVLPKNLATYNFGLNGISLSFTVTPTQLNSRSVVDGSNWFINLPDALVKTKFLWDNIKPTVYRNGNRSDVLSNVNYWYTNIGGDLKFYYNQTARTFGTGSTNITFEFHSWNVGLGGNSWANTSGDNTTINQDTNTVSLRQRVDDYIGYWRFDGSSGTIAQDESSNNNDGTLNGMNSGIDNGTSGWLSSSNCKFGNCINFADDTWINAGTSSIFNINNNITISAWVNRDTNIYPVNYSGIVSKKEWAGDVVGYAIIIQGNNKPELDFGDGVSRGNYVFESGIPLDTWTYIAFTYTAGSNATRYRNGTFSNGSSSGSKNNIANSSYYLSFGSAQGNTYSYDGKLDEIRIYNRVLNNDEINLTKNNTMFTLGNATIFHDAGTNNVTKTISANFTFPVNTNATVTAFNNDSGVLLQSWSGITSASWSQSISSAVQDTKINITLFGNSTSSPELVNFTFTFSPTVPIIQSPINNSRQYNNSINITWTLNASSNNYQVSNVSTFATTVYDSNITNNYVTVSTTEGTRYYIRVRSQIEDGFSNWSNVVEFLENNAPTVTDVTLLPTSPSNTSNLTVTINGTDDNSDTITPHFIWYQNGSINQSWDNKTYLNQSGNFSYNDTIYVKGYFNDGYENSSQTQSITVRIGSGQSAPVLPGITLSSNTRKANKSIFVNTSNIITDVDSDQVKLQVYYYSGSDRVYFDNSTFTGSNNNHSVLINISWKDGVNHTIYGSALDVAGLESTESTVTFISDAALPTRINSSLSASSITVGNTVTVTLHTQCTQTTGFSDCTIANTTYKILRPSDTYGTGDDGLGNYTMTAGNGTLWTASYTTTTATGIYSLDTFYITDNSGVTAKVSISDLTFTASTATTGSSGGGGGGGGSTVIIVQSENGSSTISFTNITSLESLKNLAALGECFSSSLMLSNKCAQSAITVVDEPLNWWVWFGSYIGSLFVLFIISLKNDEKKNFAANVLLYGTVAWVTVVLLSFMGLNLYILNYAFNSPLPGFMFLGFTMWGGIATVVGDSYSKKKR